MGYPYQSSDVEFSFYISVYIAGKGHKFLDFVFLFVFVIAIFGFLFYQISLISSSCHVKKIMLALNRVINCPVLTQGVNIY